MIFRCRREAAISPVRTFIRADVAAITCHLTVHQSCLMLLISQNALINPPRPFPEKYLCPVNTALLQHITLDFRVSYLGHGCRELLQECHWRRAKVADSIIWRHGECSCFTSYATVRGLLYIILLHRKSGIHCE